MIKAVLRRSAQLAALVFSLLLGLFFASLSSNADTSITLDEFAIPTKSPLANSSYPHSITNGPGGTLWFTEECGNKIGKITSSGDIEEYGDIYKAQGLSPQDCASGPGRGLQGITNEPNGNIRFSESGQNFIGRMSPQGQVLERVLLDRNESGGKICPESASCKAGEGCVFNGNGPRELKWGLDGNLWFVNRDCRYVGKIEGSGNVTRIPITNGASHIAVGPDGMLWFSEEEGNRIGRIVPFMGEPEEYIIPGRPFYSINNSPDRNGPDSITAGPGGKIWFTEALGNKIGRFSPVMKKFEEYRVPKTEDGILAGITNGPDGLWFAHGDRIGRITPGILNSILIEEFPVSGKAQGVTTGSDGNIWLTEAEANLIGRARTGQVNLAYIYNKDTEARDSFMEFLKGKGYGADAVLVGDIEKFDFSPYSAIIIGADTGRAGGPGKGWLWSGTPGAVNKIKSYSKPVLGMWLGGASFFSEMRGLSIDYGHSFMGKEKWGEVAIVNAANPIWNSPNPLPTANGSLALYSNGSVDYVAIEQPSPVEGVTAIGAQMADVTHFPVITQKVLNRKYALWGYSEAPAYMSIAGQALFLNILENMTQVRHPSDSYYSYPVFPVEIGNIVTASPSPGVNIIFETVSEKGDISAIEKKGTVPGVKTVGERIYDLAFTGAFTNALVCFSYEQNQITGQEGDLKLMRHGEQGWAPEESAGVDPENNVVCGNIAQPFSEYAITEAKGNLPEAFSFGEQNEVMRDTVYISGAIRVNGIIGPVPISISSGQYSVSGDGGASWSPFSSSSPGEVKEGDLVGIRLRSPSAFSTTTTTYLTIGSRTGNFSLTTLAPPDTVPPVISFEGTCPEVLKLNSMAQIKVLVTDNSRHIAYQSAPNGVSLLDTSKIGENTFSVRARDKAGLESENACTYWVAYDFMAEGGFQRPINNPPLINHVWCNFLPVKWRLSDGKGEYIKDPGVVTGIKYQQVDCEDFSRTLSDPREARSEKDEGLSYDKRAKQFVFNWHVSSFEAGQCYLFTVYLNDGLGYSARFKFEDPGKEIKTLLKP